MSHHSSHDDDPIRRALAEEMMKVFGEHPEGRLNEDDAGALPFALGIEKGNVVIHFPKPVAWIGFTPQAAMELAQQLVKHARAAGATTPLRINIG